MDHMVEAAGHVPLLDRRERGRLQEHVLDRGDDRPVTLALGALGQPFRIAREFVPLGFALGERLPGEKVVQILIAAIPDQNGPEPGLPDAVPLPQLERRGLEALEQCWQSPGHTVINPQFVDHGVASPYVRQLTLMALSGKAIARPTGRVEVCHLGRACRTPRDSTDWLTPAGSGSPQPQ